MWMDSDLKTNFWGASLEVIPLGEGHIKLGTPNEIYSITRPNSLVHNIIFGSIYVEHAGPMHVKRLVSDEGPLNFTIDFMKAGWSRSKRNIINGTIPVRPGSKHNWRIYGKWSESICCFNEETNEEMEIWRKNPMHP